MQAAVTNAPERLTTEEAAKYIGIAPGTLEVWRSTGRHEVPYRKVGHRVWYFKSDLDEWLESRKRTRTE